jgi:hypothetical protein
VFSMNEDSQPAAELFWLSAPNWSHIDLLVWLWGVLAWGQRAKRWSQTRQRPEGLEPTAVLVPQPPAAVLQSLLRGFWLLYEAVHATYTSK